MKPIKFKECDVIFAKDQPEYLPLPGHRSKDGTVTSCWKLTFLERLEVLFFGHVFLQILTFNNLLLQPSKITVCNPLKLKNNGEVNGNSTG